MSSTQQEIVDILSSMLTDDSEIEEQLTYMLDLHFDDTCITLASIALGGSSSNLYPQNIRTLAASSVISSAYFHSLKKRDSTVLLKNLVEEAIKVTATATATTILLPATYTAELFVAIFKLIREGISLGMSWFLVF